ncbi:hypothetical protein CEXT_191331, partial [Caerostris extrusa]
RGVRKVQAIFPEATPRVAGSGIGVEQCENTTAGHR